MTSWILSLGWNWALVPVAVWFAVGVMRAALVPRVKLVSHLRVGGPRGPNYLVDLHRQQRLPPWRNVRETWLLDPARPTATREGDGRYEDGYEHRFPAPSGLANAIAGALRVALARDAETDELTKTDH